MVVVPIPFSEKPGTKRRPALVLSARAFNDAGHTVLAMVTSKGHSPWPCDTDIVNLAAAGLKVPCLVRLKLFTLDNRLVLKRIGTLAANDAEGVSEALHAALPA
jgi:mRNA interferase MazF